MQTLCCSAFNTHTVYSHDTLCTLTEVSAFNTHTHARTQTVHAHSLLCSLWMGVVFFSSAALWRWKATWPFYPPLAETFRNALTNARARTHTHTHTHTHARTLSHTAMHFHFKHSFPFPARSWCAFLRNTCKDGRHKWHLTCLNRLAVHSTTSLDVGGFVCTLVPVRWPISWSKLPEWFGPGNTLVVVVFFVFLCPLLIISPITLSLQPFLGWHIRSVPPPHWGSFD